MLIRLCGELIILSLIEVDRNMKHTYKKKLSVQYYDNQYKTIYTLIWKNPIREKRNVPPYIFITGSDKAADGINIGDNLR